MLIDTAYRKYSGPMLQAMIRFSRDETAANDAVSQAFTQALVNRAMLEAPSPNGRRHSPRARSSAAQTDWTSAP